VLAAADRVADRAEQLDEAKDDHENLLSGSNDLN
jgi:hypothetical protein